MFGLGSLVCGLAKSVGVLIVSRLLQGVSGGAMLICQVAVLSQLFREGRERSRAFGWWGIVFGVGLGFGPVIGGVIVAVSSWEWVFLVHVVLSAVTLVLIFTGVEESGDPAAQRLDVWGMVSLSVAVFGFTWWITQGPSGWSVAALVMAVVSLVVFVVVEKGLAHPMFDFSVFRIREFGGAILGSMGMNFSFWPFMIYLPIYFQMGLGYGTVGAGLSLLAYTLPTLVVAPVGSGWCCGGGLVW
ncbi:MFS transporter [Puia sp. P3]|uniref:MFS transporter n=1 Tax=Puia sp. P3 TaxID=3423952 RepID=UPI003D670C74